MKSALIVWGGWLGHQPKEVAEIFRQDLSSTGYVVEVVDSLRVFADRGKKLEELNLIIPVWTMGEIQMDEVTAVTAAVEAGVGMAGCHGGMCDSFRASTEWQFMTGGQWVAHPGNDGVNYRVRIDDATHEITSGLSDFDVASEQYYLHVDPAIHVLASTDFPIADGPHTSNGKVKMPVAWTKMYGKGRIFYSSLGHQADVVASGPAREMNKRGALWAGARTA